MVFRVAKRMHFPIGIRLFTGFVVLILITTLIVLVAIGRLSELGSILRQLPEKEILEVHNVWKIRTLL